MLSAGFKRVLAIFAAFFQEVFSVLCALVNLLRLESPSVKVQLNSGKNLVAPGTLPRLAREIAQLPLLVLEINR